MRSLTVSFLLLAACSSSSPPLSNPTPPTTSAAPGSLVITHVRVFDGASIFGPADVVVEGDHIAAIAPKVATPAGVTVIDGSGGTLLPGLIDAHYHIYVREQLAAILGHGVTTALDMGSDPHVVAGLHSDALDIADFRYAGNPVVPPQGYGTNKGIAFQTIDDASQADAFVAARAQEGSSYLKFALDDGHIYGSSFPVLEDATLRAAIAAGHRRGLMSLVHIVTQAYARQAIDAGIDGLAHVWADTPADPSTVAMIVSRGLFVVPTLHANHHIPPMYYAFAAAATAQLEAAHVPLLAGSDDPQDPAGLHDELRLLVSVGLTPTEALVAATAGPAARFGLSDRGRIAVGRRADLLLVDGDPTVDITAIDRLRGIWLRGHAVPVAAD